MMKSITAVAFLAGAANSIGQSLTGQPIGHQEEKDHIMEGAKAKALNPKLAKHEHIDDYDAFIKDQTEHGVSKDLHI